MVAASAVEVHLGIKCGCYAQGGGQVRLNLVSENLREVRSANYTSVAQLLESHALDLTQFIQPVNNLG